MAYNLLCYVFCIHQMTFRFELGETIWLMYIRHFLCKRWKISSLSIIWWIWTILLTGERVLCLARSRCRVLVILPSYDDDTWYEGNPKPFAILYKHQCSRSIGSLYRIVGVTAVDFFLLQCINFITLTLHLLLQIWSAWYSRLFFFFINYIINIQSVISNCSHFCLVKPILVRTIIWLQFKGLKNNSNSEYVKVMNNFVGDFFGFNNCGQFWNGTKHTLEL
jgi:hypothetical protein